jgi:uncharacterized protein YvpB
VQQHIFKQHNCNIDQYPVLPTGCEATSLAMLLQYAGIQLSKEQVADNFVREVNPGIPQQTSSSDITIRLPGGNPHRAFVGDPYDRESFGVFHEPIANALEQYLPNRSHDLSNCTFNDLISHLTTKQKPIIVWMTIELREPRVTDEWPDVNNPDHRIQWQSPQHCALLVGYVTSSDEVITHVLVNDPHTGKQESYDKELFEKRWIQLGRQAVTLIH